MALAGQGASALATLRGNAIHSPDLARKMGRVARGFVSQANPIHFLSNAL
ncbi:hypothetical protein BN1182_CJ_00720 [Pantoea ananatis]|nr:hypothetical protein BN1182_CJ_00720 [Pantoea ananatis]